MKRVASMCVLLKVFSLYVESVCSENQALAKTPWRVYRDDMRILTDDEMKSMVR